MDSFFIYRIFHLLAELKEIKIFLFPMMIIETFSVPFRSEPLLRVSFGVL